jgi:hypothetical protein
MRFRCQPLWLGPVTALVVCPVGLLAEHRVREAVERVDVLLTTAPTLSASAHVAMIKEAAAIWRHHRVVLEWLPATAVRPVASNRLRVLVVQKRAEPGSPAGRVPVGELVRPTSGHPIALISIESAQHLISSVRGRAGYDLIAVDQRRLGVVLGRALAHEIGHYLLDTPTHARSGLMRPNFNALEFTDLRDGIFALDRAAEAWLHRRDVEKFAY